MEDSFTRNNRKPMVFIGARIQFVATINELFSGLTPPEQGKSIFNEVFAKPEGFKIKPKRPKGRQVEIYFDPICYKEDKSYLIRGAKIGKSKRTMFPIMEGSHLVEKLISTYPFVLMLWDSENQVMLIQQKSSVFSDASLPIEIIMLYLNSVLFTKGLVAKWELIKERGTFWKSIEEFEAIYSLKIELIAPNLFGSTFEQAEKFIRKLREETNGTEFSIGITNEEGQVKLNSNDKLIASIAEQIDNGGGNLKITGFKKDQKSQGKRRLNLRKQYKYIQIDEKFDDVKYLKSEKIIEITEELKEKYTLKRDEDKKSN